MTTLVNVASGHGQIRIAALREYWETGTRFTQSDIHAVEAEALTVADMSRPAGI